MNSDKIDTILRELQCEIQSHQNELTDWECEYFENHHNRYKQTLKIITENYCDGTVLEIGSMPCHLTYCLSQLTDRVVGVDLSASRSIPLIQSAKLNILTTNVEETTLPFSDDSFSFALLSEVIEHLRIDPIHALQEIRRVIKPNGNLLITTPNLYALSRVYQYIRGQGFEEPYEEYKKFNTSY